MMPHPIVKLVESELVTLRNLRRDHPSLFPQNDRLYPIPFFGDIRRAEVATLALNPSHKEFSENRRWPVNNGATALTPLALTNRLLCYFHSQTPQHSFFDDCEKTLQDIGCSYKTNAAHIDVHPYPTEFGAIIGNHGGADTLAGIIEEHSTKHLNSVLQLFGQLKLIIVIDFAVQLGEGEWMITFDYVIKRLACLTGLVDERGLKPPLIRGGSRADMANFPAERQGDLRSFLITAPSLIFSS
jgi:hypothetical protein